MMKSLKSNRYQKGFTLAEMSVIVAIFVMASGIQIKLMASNLQDKKAEAQGSQLIKAREALQRYSETNPAAIIANSAVAGVANTRAPTIGELRTLGFLNQSFPNISLYNSNYLTTIQTTPVGCVALDCAIVGMVYLDAPIVDINNEPSSTLAGAVVNKVGTHGGKSDVPGNNINGRGASWVMPNPVAGNPSNIVAARIQIGVGLGFSANTYLRRDGNDDGPGVGGMAANFDIGNNDINNIGNLQVTNAATAGNGAINNLTANNYTIANTLTVPGTGTINNLTSTTGVITTLTSTNGTITNLNSTTGNITNLTSTNGNVTNLTSTNGNVTNLTSTNGTINTVSGSNATFTGDVIGRTVVSATSLATAQQKNLDLAIVDAVLVTNNGLVSKPTCPATAPVQRIYLNSAVASGAADPLLTNPKPIQAIAFNAVDNGSSWRVIMEVTTEDGTFQPVGAYGSMTAFVKCSVL